MTDYKAIHGKNILHVASDLDNAEGEGQIWFNTASGDFKTIVPVPASWSTGGNLNQARNSLMGAGDSVSAALAFAVFKVPPVDQLPATLTIVL